MHDTITDVAGIEVGHAQDAASLTGCTVVLCPRGAVVGVDVRGGAPGTRETDLCRPGTLVDRAHAILLTGGSAFGLDAAGGVMRYLWEQGVGLDVGMTTVPIVPAAVLFDFGIGDVAWPDAAMGAAACSDARTGPVRLGSVGAGMGATVGKLRGMAAATKSGIGSASMRLGLVTVGALVATNAFGDVVIPGTRRIIAGTRDDSGAFLDTAAALRGGPPQVLHPGRNTTIGVVATDAALTSEQVNHLARCAHDGLATSIQPIHTMVDGDTMFALATGTVSVHWQEYMVALAAGIAHVVARAVVASIAHASPAGGLPAGISDSSAQL